MKSSSNFRYFLVIAVHLLKGDTSTIRGETQILQTGALSTVHVPTARQAGPDAQATMPTDDTGLTSPEMIRAQAQLAIALVHSAAHSTHAALQASHETRTPPRP
ncbi:hypothetical protein GCM10023353_01330 [Tomitella cavernea]|uniref:Uncharacterized protein n=1 Tax=Tomitella cavernea TaxID=1387982 RepID=A0ABP9C0E0_9ACTN